LSAVLTAIAWSAAWLPTACVNEPRPRFAEPKRPLLENPPPDTACPPTPPLWPPPPPPPPCAPPPPVELAPPPPPEDDVLAAMAALDAPSAMTTMRSDRCGRIKHLEMPVQPQDQPSLLRASADLMRATLTMECPNISASGKSWRLPGAREPPAPGIAIENSIIRSQEFQSLIAFSAAASNAAGVGAGPRDYCDFSKSAPHRDGGNINK
jgi:hypothetical protein